jgi:hypothetical protein
MKKFSTFINENVEQIDELTSELLGRYKQKASAQASENDKTAFSGTVSNKRASELLNKSNKRYKGIIKATGKQFDNDMKKHTNEEVEQIDEVSKQTLSSYMSSAKKGQKKAMSNILAGSQNKKTARDYTNRTSGIIKARERMKTEEIIVTESAKHNEVHVSDAGGGKYKVHAVGKKFSGGIKVGEHLTDTHLDDVSEMGGKIKMIKSKKD